MKNKENIKCCGKEFVGVSEAGLKYDLICKSFCQCPKCKERIENE